MKIGILSLYYHNYNFGGALQAYALCKYLNKKYDAEQISVKFEFPDYLRQQICKTRGIRKIKAVLSLVKYNTLQWCSKMTHPVVTNKLHIRKRQFDAFCNQIPHSIRVYTIDSVKETDKIYDMFVCGSDVIWNCGMPAFVAALGFTEKEKIAYAPSVGSSMLPDWWKKEYIPYVTKIQSISMRENSTANQLERLLEKPVECVLDPTFLLKKEDWDRCVGKEEKRTNECFCYLLGNSVIQRKQIAEFAKKNKLRLVTEPYATNQSFRKCDKYFGDLKDYHSGPKEFINHIKNSEVIITDSFHACVFSIIYNKEFYAVPRINDTDEALSGRVKSLLETLNLKERYVQNIQTQERVNIDYSDANILVEKLREKSVLFLEESVKDGEHNCSSI